jgi:predicted aldo/keto reductase-like oxidoreductase
MARKKLSRRFFIGTAAAGIAGAAVSMNSADAIAGIPDINPDVLASKRKNGMQYRRLGRTNLMISEMILGCASGLRSQQLGPVLFSRYREVLPSIVDQLIERGGNGFCTSYSYHDTEEILGRALKGRRQKAIIITGGPSGDAKKVIESGERSLVRWQTDYIDGFFCHGGWSEGFYEGAKKLQEQGKIRFIGESAHKPENHIQRIEANEIDFFLQPYNYMSLAKWTERLDGRSAEELFVLAKKKDIGVLTIKPFSGHFIPNWAKNSSDKMVQNMLDDLRSFGKKNLYQALLLWVLQNPNISAAVCGFNEPQDVVEDFEGYQGGKLTAFHEDLLKRYYALATNDYCRLCETCVPSCPKGIPIPDIQRFRMYYKNYGHTRDAREYYSSIDPAVNASACDACGICEGKCPSGVAIINCLQDAHRLLA